MKKFKKFFAFILLFTCFLSLAGCDNTSNVQIDYGISSVYSKEDMDSAIAVIKDTFAKWKGCRLHSITYSSDDVCNEQNTTWLSDISSGKAFTQCIMFKSDFRSPLFGGGGWNSNYEYTDWQWWLARTDGGTWELITHGYG